MTSICFQTVCTALHHPVMSKIFRQVPVRSILHTVSTVLSEIRWSVQESMESLSILIIRLRAVTGLRLLHHRIPKDRAETGLSIVKSTQARNKINQWFKQELKEDNILKGKEMTVNILQDEGYCIIRYLQSRRLSKKRLRKYGFKDWESMLASVGHGGLKEGQVINKLSEEYEKRKKAEITDTQRAGRNRRRMKPKPIRQTSKKK